MSRLLACAAAIAGAFALAAPAEGFVYWANFDGNATTIGRANVDGSGVNQSFITGADEPCGVAVNDTHIFWANEANDAGTTIGRANIDGSGANQSFITGAGTPCLPAVDTTHLFWTNFATDTVGRANLDGTGVNQSFVTGTGSLPCGVAVNDFNIYWGNQTGNAVGRSTISGAGPNPTFISGANDVCGVAVNGAHVYWANFDGNTIGRANLDGSGVNQSFITGASKPCGVAVDDTHVYWANNFNSTIGRADLDGSNPVQSFIAGVSGFPCGVAVDARVRTTAAGVSCSPVAAALAQPSTCTATITDTNNGAATAPAGSVGFSSAASGAGFPGGTACSLAPSGPGQSRCSVTYTPGFGPNLVLAFYGGDVAHDDATALGQVNVSSFSLGGTSFNKKRGTATLTANAPGPGVISLAGDRVIAAGEQAAAAGPVQLFVRARGVALRKLKRTGGVTVIAETEFAPTGGGQEGAANQPIRLVKRTPKKQRKK